MTRGYAVRLVVWSVLVIGLVAAAGTWFARTMPNLSRSAAAPPAVAERTDDPLPAVGRFVNRPLEWVRESWLFLAGVAFVVLCTWGAVGRPLGVFDLIHAEAGWVRVLNGLALGMVTGNALFLAYATAADLVPWPVEPTPTLLPAGDRRGPPGEADAVRRSGNYLLVTWPPVLVLMALPWLLNPKETRTAGRFPAVPLGLALSVPVGVGLVLAGWEVLGPPGTWRAWYALTPGAADGRIPPADYPLHVIATGFTLLPLAVILLLGAAAWRGRVGSPVWVVCLSLWLFNAAYGFVSFHYAGVQYVLLAAAVAVALAANAGHPYKLSLPNLGPEYAAARAGRPVPLAVTESPVGRPVPLLAADELLGRFRERWEAENGPGRKPKLVVVCASGGGIRAAVWTAAVLDGLARHAGPRFAGHVRLIAGASGGMVAAALYAGSRVRPLPAGRTVACVLSDDCLWPTWQGLFFQDAPAAFLPFYRPWDRGKSLEASWHRNARSAGGVSAMRATFADLLPAERDGLAPSLVFSPMMVEDGRRLLISNLDLADLAAASAPTLGATADGQPYSCRARVAQPAVEFFRLFAAAHGRFEVGTAARLSATFPFVSPAVSLPTSPPRRVVDAGFFDNYGVGLAAGWLLRHRDAVRRHCGGVAVVEVRAFALEEEKTGFPGAGAEVRAGSALTAALAGVSTPAEALGIVRAAGAYYRNDHLLGLLDAEFNPASGDPFFVRVPVECPGAGSLSWAITGRERDRLVGTFAMPAAMTDAGVAGPVAGLRAWFGDGGG